jgi:WD40 repeat protein
MEKIKVLIFAANPPGTDRLDLGREFREIDEEIRHGEYRDALELIFVPGARPKDLLRKLNKERPQIVHFSGHGSEEAIFFEDEDENEQDAATRSLRSDRDMKRADAAEARVTDPPDAAGPVCQPGLVEVLRACDAGNIKVVVLNACHTRPLAAAIRETIDCVVSMDKEISDRAAIRFAASFYGALAFGRSVQCAFDQAVARLKLERTFEELTPTLLVREGVDAENLVFLGSSSPAPPERESPFTVPFPRNADFVGRDQDLERLHASLSGEQPVGIRPAGLTGMGGIGKTQLAVEYAYRYRRRYPGGVFWISAVEPLVEGFAALGCRLRPDLLDHSRDEQVRAAFVELNRSPQILLIVDNLAEPSDLNRPVAPGCIPAALACRILFTTRRRDLGRFGQVEVTVLPEEPALRLLLRHPDRQPILDPAHPEHQDARAICRMLGRLPLALELAGAFLGEWSDIRLADYRERLKSEGLLATLDDEAAELPAVHLPAIHDAAVTATLNSQWEALQDETSRLLLRVAGQLPEAAAIPIARLGLLAGIPGLDRPGKPALLARALKRLEDACLAEGLLDKQLRLHPLVREFALRKTYEDQTAGFRSWCAGNVVDAYLNYTLMEDQARERGIDAMQEDLIAAHELCPAEADDLRQRVEVLLRLLQREAHVLRAWDQSMAPALFAQQIHNRAVVMDLGVFEHEASNRLSQLRQPHALLLWRASRESPALIRTLNVHSSWVYVVAVTADGRQAITGSDDPLLKLWDLPTGRELLTFTGHTGRVNDVALTTDGRHVVSASDDCTLRLWDLQTGQELHTFSGHGHRVNSVAVLPAGRHAISASDDGTLRIWDLTTGQELRTLWGHGGWVNAVAVSADGRRAISGSFDRTLILWDLESGEALRTFGPHHAGVNTVVLTSDGRHAISGSDDRTLRLWDLESGRELSRLTGHRGVIWCVGLTPDGRHAVSGSSDFTLKLWDLHGKGLVRTLYGHEASVNGIAFTPDGKYVLSASSDRTLKQWDLDAEIEPETLAGHGGVVWSIDVTPDGRRAISASDDYALKLWDLGSGREIRELVGHEHRVNCVAVTPDGRHAVSASEDETLGLWDLETGREVRSLLGHKSSVNAAAVTPDGEHVVSGAANGMLKVWGLHTGQDVGTFRGHEAAIWSVALTPNGSLAVSASTDCTLRVWELHKRSQRFTLEGHQNVVNAVKVTPDGSHALSASSDLTIKLWDLGTGRLVRTMLGHEGMVWGLAVSRDGRHAFSTSFDRTLRLWDLPTGRCLMCLPIDGSPTALALSPLGDLIVLGDRAGNVQCLSIRLK